METVLFFRHPRIPITPETAEPNNSGWLALPVAGVSALRHSRCSAFLLVLSRRGWGRGPLLRLSGAAGVLRLICRRSRQ